MGRVELSTLNFHHFSICFASNAIENSSSIVTVSGRCKHNHLQLILIMLWLPISSFKGIWSAVSDNFGCFRPALGQYWLPLCNPCRRHTQERHYITRWLGHNSALLLKIEEFSRHHPLAPPRATYSRYFPWSDDRCEIITLTHRSTLE